MKRALLVEDTATHLRRQIASGAFSSELPPCRELAKSLQVSVPTLLSALERLAEEGLVVRGKPRRPYRLGSEAKTPAKPAARRKVILLISPKPIGEFESSSRSGVDRVMLECVRHGWEFHHRIIPYADATRSSPRWDEVLDEVRPTQLVALAGNKVLAEWASRRGMPTLFVGGAPANTPVVAVGVSLRARLESALDKLLALGHRHICMPVCGLQDYLSEPVRTQFADALAARNIPFVPNYHVPTSPTRNPTTIPSLLAKVFNARIPSAMVFVEWIDFVATAALLANRGLAFGRDIVGVVLTYDSHIEWFQPRPAHFRLPLQRLERILGEWLKNPAAPRFRKGGLMLQPFRFYEGDAFRGPGGGG
ncbi:GntR family transcriptional regulator [Luteolibacter ambystomatis]|uniref:GntR family transcriptional regulator n=1 Tax=Luteolibacter ambystomatis TaxID=2824561 RepID=A0A975G7Z3_9BACT|nr:GntR family transcriptional regulator [Luteolibacter ambystomatis]QUE50482.1 GntR family transcriptional regulator [Luteolibacter ambystomatis]